MGFLLSSGRHLRLDMEHGCRLGTEPDVGSVRMHLTKLFEVFWVGCDMDSAHFGRVAEFGYRHQARRMVVHLPIDEGALDLIYG